MDLIWLYCQMVLIMSGDIDENSRHYAWQRVEFVGTDNQHGAQIQSVNFAILYLFDDGVLLLLVPHINAGLSSMPSLD
jgi:hypothetical protein